MRLHKEKTNLKLDKLFEVFSNCFHFNILLILGKNNFFKYKIKSKNILSNFTTPLYYVALINVIYLIEYIKT